MEFNRPVIAIWELSLPQKKHKNFKERTFTQGSICELNKSVWMAGSGRKVPGAQFPEKEVLIFEFHWTIDSPMGTVAHSNRYYGLYLTSISQVSIYKVNKSNWMATRASEIPEYVLPKKDHDFLMFIGPVTAIWVL